MSVPPRTTNKQVEALLADNWDGCTSVAPYIRAASALVDQVVLKAASKCPAVALTSEDLIIIETWLAAYRYTLTDPLFTTRGQGGSSGGFLNGNGQSVEGEQNRYKRGAIESDYSGCLHAILNRLVARTASMGREHHDRDFWNDQQ